MSNLYEMNQQMTRWQNEKPVFNSGNELRLNTGDLVFFNFVSSGNDGNQFISIYKSHIIPRMSQKGTRYNATVWCPKETGYVDIPCPQCAVDSANIKERMSIWMYVHVILHATMPPEKQYPQVQYGGKVYFQENINAFKIWHTSAWRESPWNSIMKLHELYKGLHSFTAQLEAVGAGMSRRYMVIAMPNSAGLPAELYEQAKAECEHIMNILKAQLGSPVQAAPQTGPAMTGYAPVQNLVQPFNPPGNTTAAPVFDFTRPPATAAPVQENMQQLPAMFAQSDPNQPPQEAAEEAVTDNTPPWEEKPEEDNRRPTKSMF